MECLAHNLKVRYNFARENASKYPANNKLEFNYLLPPQPAQEACDYYKEQKTEVLAKQKGTS